MIIHATSITTLTDARYFAAREVQALGYILDEGHPQYMDPSAMKAIREWVEGPALVGWFFKTSLDIVQESARFYQLDAVVIDADGLTTAPAIEESLVYSVYLQKNQALPTNAQPQSVICKVNDLQIDGEWVSEICRRHTTLIEIDDYNPKVLEAWLALGVHGFCLHGGMEERTGVKEFTDLEDFFDWVETHNQQIS
jgi:phosphoribosylanthranilate isomerase